jgi:hypothetical protein
MVHLLFDIAGAVATCCPTFSIENIPAEYKVVVYIYICNVSYQCGKHNNNISVADVSSCISGNCITSRLVPLVVKKWTAQELCGVQSSCLPSLVRS